MTRAAIAPLCLAAVLLAGCGSSSGGNDAKTKKAFDPFTDVRQQPADAKAATRNAAPRWEHVATLTGSGAATRPVTIARGAIQWRARYHCGRGGRLGLTVIQGSQRRTLTDAGCPRNGTSTGFRTGALQLGVKATGSWRVTIDQQITSALHEQPLAAMRSSKARVIARGRFYDIERVGRGTASVYRLPSGRLALRLDGGFATSANTDLFLWLSTARHPKTTVQANRAPHTVLHALKSTLGEQNYVLPAGLKASRVRSVVIWCEPVQIAYTAATMR